MKYYNIRNGIPSIDKTVILKMYLIIIYICNTFNYIIIIYFKKFHVRWYKITLLKIKKVFK